MDIIQSHKAGWKINENDEGLWIKHEKISKKSHILISNLKDPKIRKSKSNKKSEEKEEQQ